jgi:hypothetical protein
MAMQQRSQGPRASATRTLKMKDEADRGRRVKLLRTGESVEAWQKILQSAGEPPTARTIVMTRL